MKKTLIALTLTLAASPAFACGSKLRGHIAAPIPAPAPAPLPANCGKEAVAPAAPSKEVPAPAQEAPAQEAPAQETPAQGKSCHGQQL